MNKQSNPTGPWLWAERLVSPQYLACLSTSSSKDKLAFDVGLQEHSKGESRGGFDTIVFCFRYCVVWYFKLVDGEYWRTYIHICLFMDIHIHKETKTFIHIFAHL